MVRPFQRPTQACTAVEKTHYARSLMSPHTAGHGDQLAALPLGLVLAESIAEWEDMTQP